jgi:CRISPR system Cascade subunit CasE
MNEPLYFSRARLKAGRGEALAPLAGALLDGSKGHTVAQAHRIVWMLFNDGAREQPIVDAEGKNRLFLWREKTPGEYYILSRTPPRNAHDLFSLDTQEFTPSLSPGDVLRFSLRANPVVTRKNGRSEGKQKLDGKGRLRGLRCDIVMDALKPFEGKRERDERKDLSDEERRAPTERGKNRESETAKAARAWIEEQGRKAGFVLVKKPDADDGVFLSASNYDTVRIQRLQGPGYAAPATFGVLDFEGLIEVTDPTLLLSRLADGFGKAKAFGCGLMLIRRA